MLPFTREQFFEVFAAYNTAVWPAQGVAYALALAMLAVLWRRPDSGGWLIGAGLALLWGWTGVVYHGVFFAAINPAARVFALLFTLQAALSAVAGPRLRFRPDGGVVSWLGWAGVAYAMVLYPLLGLAGGHHYPAVPVFGIAPCPLTLFTIGLLLLAHATVPLWLLAIPFAWALIGGSAAFLLHVPQDWVLLFSAAAAPAIAVLRRPRRAPLKFF